MNDFNGYKIALGCIFILEAFIKTVKEAKTGNNPCEIIARFLGLWMRYAIIGTLLFFA